jgi:hypothetical protein
MANVFVVRFSYKADGKRFLLGVASTLATAKRLSVDFLAVDEQYVEWDRDEYGAHIGTANVGITIVIDESKVLTRNAIGFEV